MMIRAVLCLVIIACSALIGIRAGASLREKVYIIEETMASLLQLKGDISYLLMPVLRSFSRMGERYPLASPLYDGCLERFESLNDLKTAWHESAGEFVRSCGLGREVLEALHALGEALGRSDEKTQRQAIDYTMESLKGALYAAREKSRRMGPVLNNAGIAGGLTLALLIL